MSPPLPDFVPDTLVARARTVLHLIYALVLAIVAVAVLWQFSATRALAQALLASGTLLAVVIGLAVQGTLGNVVAGIVLTFAEPVRVGDHVTIGEHTGRVAHIGVSYTRLDVGDGSHVEYPNSVLAVQEIVVKRDPPPSHRRDGGIPS